VEKKNIRIEKYKKIKKIQSKNKNYFKNLNKIIKIN
jgi:hypothetical protein